MKKDSTGQEEGSSTFTWASLGDIPKGRGDLGTDVPVLVYRLMQYTMMDILSQTYGTEQAKDCFRQAGYLAGVEFAQNVLELKVSFSAFSASLQQKLAELKIGILRIEFFDRETGEIVLTVAEDVDCSGLSAKGETVCYYDEGFIAGVLDAYTGETYQVREIDCWASGALTCRFRGVLTGGGTD